MIGFCAEIGCGDGTLKELKAYEISVLETDTLANPGADP
jgi:hypothetical protein